MPRRSCSCKLILTYCISVVWNTRRKHRSEPRRVEKCRRMDARGTQRTIKTETQSRTSIAARCVSWGCDRKTGISAAFPQVRRIYVVKKDDRSHIQINSIPSGSPSAASDQMTNLTLLYLLSYYLAPRSLPIQRASYEHIYRPRTYCCCPLMSGILLRF